MDDHETGAAVADQEKVVPEDGAKVESAALTADSVKELIKEAVAETNKTWQSRFDKLREEKETEKKAKETTEERIARIEKEREDERIGFAREKAIARSGVDDAVFAYAEQIASRNVEQIQAGVDGLVKWIEARNEKIKAEVYDKAYKETYAKPGAPKVGDTVDIQAQIKQAQAAGNVAKVLDLKRKLKEV